MHCTRKQVTVLCSKLTSWWQSNSSEVAWDIIQTLVNVLASFKRETLYLNLNSCTILYDKIMESGKFTCLYLSLKKRKLKWWVNTVFHKVIATLHHILEWSKWKAIYEHVVKYMNIYLYEQMAWFHINRYTYFY